MTGIVNQEHAERLEDVAEMVRTCMQCGTCTGTCPNEFAMDVPPRKLWQMVINGNGETVFNSRTFALCSSCYHCTLRCPRGLPLTEAMAALKRIATSNDIPGFRKTSRFYRNFMKSVRRHGRVHETEFMMFYFISMKNPLLPLKYSPLGMKLMIKGKISPVPPVWDKNPVLEPIFSKAEDHESSQNA